MKYLFGCALFALLFPFGLSAQTSDYERQIEVIEAMIERGDARGAIAQAQGLATAGREASLPDIEAHAIFLTGLAQLSVDAADARVEGVASLRDAAKIYRRQRNGIMVDSIANLLVGMGERGAAAGADPEGEVQGSLRSRRRARLRDLPTDAEIDEDALNAIVDLQEREIMALTDSQLRQMVILEQKDRLLDDYAFRTLEDSLQLVQRSQELRQQQVLIKEEQQRRNFFILLAVASVLLLGLLFARYRSGKKHEAELEEQNQIIELERQRSDELLLNILPAPIAEELKAHGKATARSYDVATVMFIEIGRAHV